MSLPITRKRERFGVSSAAAEVVTEPLSLRGEGGTVNPSAGCFGQLMAAARAWTWTRTFTRTSTPTPRNVRVNVLVLDPEGAISSLIRKP